MENRLRTSVWVLRPPADGALDTNVGKTKSQNYNKHNFTLETFFVLVTFAILNFFLSLKILILAISFFAILLFPIHATCGEGNSKTTKNENAKNKILSARKKIKIAKNIKTKNVFSVVLIFEFCFLDNAFQGS